MYNVNDKVIILDYRGRETKCEIINVNRYREPNMRYAVYIEGFNDYAFVGEDEIIRKVE